MKKVKLGTHGALVPRMGLGCMGVSAFYGERKYAGIGSNLTAHGETQLPPRRNP